MAHKRPFGSSKRRAGTFTDILFFARFHSFGPATSDPERVGGSNPLVIRK